MIAGARHLHAQARAVDPVHLDYAIAAVILATCELSALGAHGEKARWVTVGLGAAIPLVLAHRRRRTIEALCLTLVVMALKRSLAGTQPHASGVAQTISLFALILVFYSAGAYLEGRRGTVGFGLATLIGSLVSFKGASVPAALGSLVAFVWLPWLVGRTRRVSATREQASRELAERVDAERELHVRTAALGERARLAREIHDVIAHSVSVMVIQASGARTVMGREPDRAEASLRSVERAGREALAEMRRLLGILSDGQDPRALAPQPGLDDLTELVSNASAAGLQTSITVEGQPVTVPLGLSLCAYRVVQEALTNTLKHASATRAEVEVRWADGELELKVTDAGPGRATASTMTGAGHGLVGMRERVELHGGRVDAGPEPDGGFSVLARIPLLAGSEA